MPFKYLDDASQKPSKFKYLDNPDSPTEDKSSHVRELLSQYARPALEFGGGLGGAALGEGASLAVGGVPVGVPAGGALGFAGGKAAADFLDRFLGVKKPVESAPEALKETGQDVVFGAETQALGDIAGKALPLVVQGGAKAAGLAGKKALSTVFGPSMDAIEARLANPEAIRGAKSMDVLAREFPEGIQKLESIIRKQTNDAFSKLKSSEYLDENAFPKDSLLRILDNARDDIGRGISDASYKAKAMLDRYAERLRFLHQTVSEQDLGNIMRDIRNDIRWDDPAAGPANEALKKVQGTIDDVLKTRNPDYAAAMEPLADNMRLLDKSKTLFSVRQIPGKGLEASNATGTALQSALKETKVSSQDVLQKLKEVTQRDFLEEVQNALYARQFEGGATQGSRRVNLGAILGGTAGGLGGHLMGPVGSTAGGGVGAAAGALAGSYLDKEGGRVAANLIDFYLGHNPQALGTFAPALQVAAKRGPQWLLATHLALVEKDPNYKGQIMSLPNLPAALEAADAYDKERSKPMSFLRMPKGNLKAEPFPSPASAEAPRHFSEDMIAYREGLDHFAAGDHDAAEKSFRKAVKLNPKNKFAQRALERFEK